MRKILSILLVFVLFYSIMGFYLNFKIEQYQVKREIKHKIINNLPEKELTLIKISSGNSGKIKWMEEDKEFRYNGKMYDVVKIKKVNDTTYYYCFNDEKESKLLSHLDNLVKEQTGNSKSRTIQKKQVTDYFFQQILFAQFVSKEPIKYFSYSSVYKSVIKDVLSPPPKQTNIINYLIFLFKA